MDLSKFKDGDRVTCKIKGVYINDAKINVIGINKFYICHNNYNFDGSKARDKFGYRFSWAFNDAETSGVAEVKLLNEKRYSISYEDGLEYFGLHKKEKKVFPDSIIEQDIMTEIPF